MCPIPPHGRNEQANYYGVRTNKPPSKEYEQNSSKLHSSYVALRFESYDELLDWFEGCSNGTALGPTDRANVAREKLENYLTTQRTNGAGHGIGSKLHPSVTVLHDAKSGYDVCEDKLVLGDYDHPSGNHYWLRWPELVDEFIYFSHSFLTVPSATWVNCLHRHGIPVVGSFVLQEVEGRYTDPSLFRRDDDGEYRLVKILVSLCQLFHFEGWLLKFETRFTGGPRSAMDFVRALQNRLRTNVKQGRLIWCDSYVTTLNKPLPQNEVNSNNWDFFNISDKVLTNASWDVHNLENTVQNVGAISVQNKLLWGVDVWGRGMKVGTGGLTSDQPVKLIAKFGSNVCLIAPAWDYENFQYNDFLDVDDEFWTSIRRKISRMNYDESMHNNVSWFINNDSISFLTFFSTGAGTFFNFNGSKISSKNWVQLSMSTPMPIKNDLLTLDKSDSFIGGSCLSITIPKFQSEPIRLFNFQRQFKAGVVDNYQLKIHLCHKGYIKGILPFVLVKCYIIRRTKKTSHMIKVKDLSIKVPLEPVNAWEYATATVNIPKLSVSFNEEFLIESCELDWGINSFEVADLGEEPWLIIPEDVSATETDSVHSHYHSKSNISLGLFSVEITQKQKSNIYSETRLSFSNGHLEWTDIDDTFMWLVLEEHRLKGITFVNFWPTASPHGLQLYKVQRNGEITDVGSYS